MSQPNSQFQSIASKINVSNSSDQNEGVTYCDEIISRLIRKCWK